MQTSNVFTVTIAMLNNVLLNYTSGDIVKFEAWWLSSKHDNNFIVQHHRFTAHAEDWHTRLLINQQDKTNWQMKQEEGRALSCSGQTYM